MLLEKQQVAAPCSRYTGGNTDTHHTTLRWGYTLHVCVRYTSHHPQLGVHSPRVCTVHITPPSDGGTLSSCVYGTHHTTLSWGYTLLVCVRYTSRPLRWGYTLLVCVRMYGTHHASLGWYVGGTVHSTCVHSHTNLISAQACTNQ